MSGIRNRVKSCAARAAGRSSSSPMRSGVSRQSINSIERERYVPSLELALSFGRAFEGSHSTTSSRSRGENELLLTNAS